MTKRTKTVESFITNRFGFPVELKHVQLKQVLGEWVPDVNANTLSQAVLAALVMKPGPWTGAEVKFVRLSQGLSQADFGEIVEVTHAAVSKWESRGGEIAKMGMPSEFVLRFKLLTRLGDAFFHLVDTDGNVREMTRDDLSEWLTRALLQVEEKITPRVSRRSEPVGIDWREIQQSLPMSERPRA